jgi:basic amino acid/polyamine antiporter, APA family
MSESSAATQPEANGPAHGQLSLWDTVSIIIGIVIGSTIFTTPTVIFESVAGPWEGLGIWLFCGALSFVGAMCYAELATTYPRYGGDYVYLTRGFDRPMGFLFGWSQLAVILSGSAGAMAFIFGDYLGGFLNLTGEERTAFTVQAAVGAIIVLTAVNFFGVVLGKWLQNGLVLVKLLGLALIVVAGLKAWLWEEHTFSAFHVPENAVPGGGGIPVAMILVLYAYGGWNDAAFVAADLRDRRNIPKALLLGTLGITVIYFVVNFAYVLGMGFEAVRKFSPNIAADVLNKAFGDTGLKLISIIVMISALGAMNGLIFTGSRVYLSLGKEHRVFGLLGHWNATLKAPIWSLLAQALVTILMVLAVGTKTGRDAIDGALDKAFISAVPWDQYHGGFLTLYAGTAPTFWIFFLLTGFSMFALRARDPKIARPFELKAPLYPVLPIIFCGMCLFGFYAAMKYAGWISLLGFVPLLLGLPLYWISGKGHEAEVAAGATDPVTPGPATDDRFTQ